MFLSRIVSKIDLCHADDKLSFNFFNFIKGDMYGSIYNRNFDKNLKKNDFFDLKLVSTCFLSLLNDKIS